ncbi:hypothetical protein [Streptomyces solaniscabiei]|uniref:hypothetical protein n=1 Tax=Streptomyces solaniscabiei TaxID=2683255 RepID=UPI001CE3575B|nr:hypothetical protein [Streptomyces solaniscabiei]
MREKPEAGGEADMRTEVESKRIDLSVPQVAGSALAAVVAAKLASSFGVYGTILGAGLISVIATCGGSVFQHFFRRTAEQLRAKRAAEARVAAGAARSGGRTAPAPGEFTEGTVYRARVTSWKRPLVAAALVFGVTMGGITAYEVVSGHNLSGGQSTTVGSAFSGHGKSASDPGESGGSGDSEESPAPTGSAGSKDPGDSGTGDDAPAATPSGTPSGSEGGTSSDGTSPEDGGTGPGPAPTSSATGSDESGEGASPAPDASATTPAPGASSRSGTGDQGQDGPAAP